MAASDEALQVRRRHPTESGMLVLATLFFIFATYLTSAELNAFYIRDKKEWDAKPGRALRDAQTFVDELLTQRKGDGMPLLDTGESEE